MSKYVVDLMRPADESILELANHDNTTTIEMPLTVEDVRIGDVAVVTEEPVTRKVYTEEVANTSEKEVLSRTLLNSEIAAAVFTGQAEETILAHAIKDVLYGSTMQDVFDTWKRISHKVDIAEQPAVPAELDSWSYDADTDLLKCTINSSSFLGFVSPVPKETYVLDTVLSSTDPDNDLLAVIAGYEEVDGKEHTIVVTRSRSLEPHQQVNGQFDVWYNYHQADAHLLATVNPEGDTVGPWTGIMVRIKVERDGDLFTVKSSDYIQTEDGSIITDDLLVHTLEVRISENPEIAMFEGASSWGYGCMSQGQATFHINQRADQEIGSTYRQLVDVNGRLWRYGYEDRVVAEGIDTSIADINTMPVRDTEATLFNREYEKDQVGIRFNRLATTDVVDMTLADGDFAWFDPSRPWDPLVDVPAAIKAFKDAALRQEVSIDLLKHGAVTMTLDEAEGPAPKERFVEYHFASMMLKDGVSARYRLPTHFHEVIKVTELDGFVYSPFTPEQVKF